MMTRIIAFVLALVTAWPAQAMDINGELKKALLEKLSSDPTSTEARLYYNTSTKKAKIYNGSSWGELGGAGSGEKNYVTSPNSATGWTTATVTATTTTTGANLPRESTTASGISIAAGTTTSHYAAYCFTIDDADKNTKLKVKWDQKPASYTSGDFRLEVYSFTSAACGGSATELALSTDDVSGNSGIVNAELPFYSTFDSTTADYYGIRIVRVAGSSTLVISDVVVGPGIVSQGAAVGAWQSFTPSWTNGPTMSTNVGFWRRVGDSMQVYVHFVASGTGTNADIAMTLPDSKTIETSKIPNSAFTTAAQPLGYGNWWDDSATSWLNLSPVPASSTTVKFLRVLSSVATDYIDGADMAANDEFGNNFTVVIAEWTGNGTVTIVQNDVEFASNSSTDTSNDTTSFSFGSAGNLIPNRTVGTAVTKRVRFATPRQIGEVYDVLFWDTNGWFLPEQLVGGTVYQSSKAYGIRLTYVSATDVDVIFSAGGYRPNNATYAGDGSPWSDLFTANWKWVLTKHRIGQAVGVGAATITSSGLVSTGTQSFAGDKTFNGTTQLGAAVTGNATGGKHIVSGNLYAGNVTSTGGSGEFAVGSNIRFGSGAAQTGRTDTTTGGAGLTLANNAADTGDAISFQTNAVGAATSTNATTRMAITHEGIVYTNGTLGVNTKPTTGATYVLYVLSQTDNSTSQFHDYTAATITGSDTIADYRFTNDADATGGLFMNFKDSSGSNGSISVASASAVAFNTTSDVRLKKDIENFDGALALVKKMQPRRYRWKEDGHEDRGFVAQELVKVYPFAVSGEPDGDVVDHPMQVDYGKLTPVAIAAIKELMAEVEVLKKEVSKLKAAANQ